MGVFEVGVIFVDEVVAVDVFVDVDFRFEFLGGGAGLFALARFVAPDFFEFGEGSGTAVCEYGSDYSPLLSSSRAVCA